MATEVDMNIDYEKLRKHLKRKEFVSIVVYHSYVERFGRACDATPEQLLTLARRYKVNLDHYKKK